jgi:hypothetical protein
MLGGDLSIVDEIESRNDTLQLCAKGQAARDFLVQADDSQVAKRRQLTGPAELENATLGQRQMFVDACLTKQQDEVVQQRVSTLKSAVDLMEMLGGLDDRDKIEFKDKTRLALRPLAAGSTQATCSTLTVATTVVNPDVSVPTPDCDKMVRGTRISIPVIASELSVAVGDKAGQVGKMMRVLDAQRYGACAAENIPKRQTSFKGKPINENTYYSRDKDLLVQDVHDILGQK